MKKQKNNIKNEILSKFILYVAAVIAILLIYFATEPRYVVANYTYETCNNLWELTKYCPEQMNKRKFIDEIIELNGMENATVHSNRLYQIPIYEVKR